MSGGWGRSRVVPPTQKAAALLSLIVFPMSRQGEVAAGPCGRGRPASPPHGGAMRRFSAAYRLALHPPSLCLPSASGSWGVGVAGVWSVWGRE